MAYRAIQSQALVGFKDSLGLDAFNRNRISSPTNRFDIEFIYDKQPLLVQETTADGATATHQADERDVLMAINGVGNAASVKLESLVYVPYTPGNSQLVEMTAALDHAAIGSGTAEVFIRSSVSGSVVETSIEQSSWSGNKLLDTDWSKSQIFGIDFQSLKVGRIRFFMVRNGVATEVHEIENDNIRSSGYWQSPSLPQYWHMYNVAADDETVMEVGYGDSTNAIGFRYKITRNAAATMAAICGTVKSEGGDRLLDIAGLPFSADNGTTAKTVSTTLIPLLSIRGAATFNSLVNNMLIIPQSITIETNNPIRYEILLNATLTTPSWTAVQTNSGTEYDVTASAVSGGVRIGSDYVSTRVNTTSNDKNLLSKGVVNRNTTLTIAAIRTGTSDGTTRAAINFKEIR